MKKTVEQPKTQPAQPPAAASQPEKPATPSALAIANRVLLRLPQPVLQETIHTFYDQPLPALSRLELRPVTDAIIARRKVLVEEHIVLIKKHGGAEEPPKSGVWHLAATAPGYPAFQTEYKAFADATFELPLTTPVRLPARVPYRGDLVDVVLDGPAAALLDGIVEVVR